ncbi:MAG: hypothetical protein Kilf2KO_32180 [Rhodospirillales bacterium]
MAPSPSRQSDKKAAAGVPPHPASSGPVQSDFRHGRRTAPCPDRRSSPLCNLDAPCKARMTFRRQSAATKSCLYAAL